MITAMLTTLGILLGVIVFCIILGVGLIEVIKSLIRLIRNK